MSIANFSVCALILSKSSLGVVLSYLHGLLFDMIYEKLKMVRSVGQVEGYTASRMQLHFKLTHNLLAFCMCILLEMLYITA